MTNAKDCSLRASGLRQSARRRSARKPAPQGRRKLRGALNALLSVILVAGILPVLPGEARATEPMGGAAPLATARAAGAAAQAEEVFITDIDVLYGDQEIPVGWFSFDGEKTDQQIKIAADVLTTQISVRLKVNAGENTFLRVMRDGAQTVTGYTSDVRVEENEITFKPFTVWQTDDNKAGHYSFSVAVGEKTDSDGSGTIDAADIHLFD